MQVERAKRVDLALGPQEEATFRKYWASFAERPLAGRDLLVRAVCPQLHGNWLPKLALLLALLGGVSRTDSRGTHLRGAVHMLLLGDTATGKSRLLVRVLQPAAARALSQTLALTL